LVGLVEEEARVTSFELIALVIVGLGLFAGAFLVAQRPSFWFGLGLVMLKAAWPFLSKRMSKEDEAEMRREQRAGRGDEWLKKWHRRKR
jgi:Ca2+/Na+ antiporter